MTGARTGLLGLLLASMPVWGPVCGAAWGAELLAGPGTPFPVPSAAIAAAAAGDTVVVLPGTYYDCASWRTDRVTVEGRVTDGQRPVFSDMACGGKASFVVGGNGTVLRGLGFTHMRVPDGNGAGVRLEGGSLLVENCTFEDEEAAVLASGGPDTALVLRRVVVSHVGVPGGSLAAVTSNGPGSVRVEDSRFADNRGEGGALRSAGPAVVAGSSFSYGPGSGAVLEASGPVEVEGSTFQLTGPRPAAVRALGPGATVRNSTLDNRSGGAGVLLLDWTGGTAVLSGNTVAPGNTERSSAGRLVNQVKDAAHGAAGLLRHVAGRVRRML